MVVGDDICGYNYIRIVPATLAIVPATLAIVPAYTDVNATDALLSVKSNSRVRSAFS